MCLFAGLVAHALAQESVPPTDQELRVAYCLGVQQSMYAEIQPLADRMKLTDEDSRRLVDEAKKEQERRIQRLQAYLVAKGFMSGRWPLPILIAHASGKSDWSDCMRAAESPSYSPCLQSCFKEGSEDCPGRCVPACKRMGRCSNIDETLPF